ncbi:uncharacterized protein V6R79_017266 [Siganus canaliculatus]
MTTVSSKSVLVPKLSAEELSEPVPERTAQATNCFQPPVHQNLTVKMENLQEFIPFAREMLSQKPNRGLLKVYFVGSVFAVLGTVIGLVETVCYPFSSGETLDTVMAPMLTPEPKTVEAETQHNVEDQDKKKEDEDEEEKQAHINGVTTQTMTFLKPQVLSQRSSANRLYAS